MTSEIMKRMREIENLITYHSKKYYEDDDPEISDYEYDMLFRELLDLEKEYPQFKNPNSPTVRVGGKVSSRFEEFTHVVQLASLTDVFSLDELDSFLVKNQTLLNKKDVSYSCEPKIDGLSVALTYTDGLFERGATRGNGFIGEDVTDNLKTISSIPMKLNDKVSITVRGEVYMSRSVFSTLNKTRERKGQKQFANPRNAAAGSLRQLDSSVTASRHLDIFVFNLQSGNIYTDRPNPDSHTAILDRLTELGFKVIENRKKISTIENINDYISGLGKLRDDLSYDTDGAVVKMDSISEREIVGSGTSTPNWAVAFKYPPEEKETELIDIIWTVGRTGVLTPNAVMTPVRLSGTMVSKATLHNFDFINSKSIVPGDRIIIRKAGEIIPEVVRKVSGGHTETMPAAPEICPSCGHRVYRDEEKAIRCYNPECPAQLARQLEHFASKEAMDIDGLGPNIINMLIDRKLIASECDLYKLSENDLRELPGFGEKSAFNLISSISKSKNAGFERLLYALGIRQVGEVAAKNIARHFKNIRNMYHVTVESLTPIGDIGAITAGFISDYFNDETSLEHLDRLYELGLNFDCAAALSLSDSLSGKTFVITGTLPSMKRDEAKRLIEINGGKVSSSVSSKTDYLLCGDDPGSKYDNAVKLNIPIISENDLQSMIKNVGN